MREIRSPLDGILSPFAARPAVFTPADLFASGEDGAWYDPSDTTSLYQSRTGGDYADTDGDVVGIMLDKSQMGSSTAADFIAAQLDLVTNGEFENNINSWLLGGTPGAGDSIQWNNGVLEVTRTTNNITAYQGVSTTVGTYYKVSLGSVSDSFSRLYVSTSTAASNNSDVVGAGNFIFKATATTTYIHLRSAAIATQTFDDVSVIELPGNHAVAPSDAARPLYKTAGGLHWLEFDGVDDYLVATVNGLSSTTVNALAFNPGADTAYIATSLSASIYWHYTQIGNPGGFDSGVGSPSYRLNGADIVYTSRGDTHSNWANNDNISIVQNLNLPSTASFYLFNYATFSGLYTQGKMYGALLLDRALTTDELADLESYLAAKSGVTL